MKLAVLWDEMLYWQVIGSSSVIANIRSIKSSIALCYSLMWIMESLDLLRERRNYIACLQNSEHMSSTYGFHLQNLADISNCDSVHWPFQLPVLCLPGHLTPLKINWLAVKASYQMKLYSVLLLWPFEHTSIFFSEHIINLSEQLSNWSIFCMWRNLFTQWIYGDWDENSEKKEEDWK